MNTSAIKFTAQLMLKIAGRPEVVYYLYIDFHRIADSLKKVST